MEFTRTDVDGVPTFWTSTDGELRAGLVFRVGQADETLPRHGITHLIEHLALHAVGLADADGVHHNGAVGWVTTTFMVSGDAAQVNSFFAAVCAALRDLPFDRMDRERQVLRAEARTRGAASPLRVWRYGARGYGLPGMDEFGARTCAPDDMREWAARWFTRGNAAMWISGGPPPAGLRLDLPDGERRTTPVPAAVLPATPAYFHRNDFGGVAFSGITGRGVASSMYREILRRRLMRELRERQGITYTPTVGYDVRDRDTAEITAVAEGLPESVHVLVASFARELDRLDEGRIEQDEITAVAEKWCAAAGETNWIRSRVGYAARNEVLGGTTDSTAAWMDRVRALTPDDVRDVAHEGMQSGLFMLPRHGDLLDARVVAAPVTTLPAVSGRAARHADYPLNPLRLVVGADGVSLVTGDESVTVRFAECAAVVAYADGGRRLIGNDAATVAVTPRMWRTRSDVVARIDAAASPDLVIGLPARADAEIPRPGTSRLRRGAARVLISPAIASLTGIVLAAGVLIALAILDPGLAPVGAVILIPVVVIGSKLFLIAREYLLISERKRRRFRPSRATSQT